MSSGHRRAIDQGRAYRLLTLMRLTSSPIASSSQTIEPSAPTTKGWKVAGDRDSISAIHSLVRGQGQPGSGVDVARLGGSCGLPFGFLQLRTDGGLERCTGHREPSFELSLRLLLRRCRRLVDGGGELHALDALDDRAGAITCGPRHLCRMRPLVELAQRGTGSRGHLRSRRRRLPSRFLEHERGTPTKHQGEPLCVRQQFLVLHPRMGLLPSRRRSRPGYRRRGAAKRGSHSDSACSENLNGRGGIGKRLRRWLVGARGSLRTLRRSLPRFR